MRRFVAVGLIVGVAVGVPAAASAAMPQVRTAAAAVTIPVGVKQGVPSGHKGFDTSGIGTANRTAAAAATQNACMRGAGYGFQLVNTNQTNYADYTAAAKSGLLVVLYQGYNSAYWANPARGALQGAKAVAMAQVVKYPKGAEIFLNVEDTYGNTTATKLLTWINGWAAKVRAAGYVAGLYIGVPQALSTAQVNSISGVVFWRSASSSAPQAARGFAVRQTAIDKGACGIPGGIDTDTSGVDTRGTFMIGAVFPKR